MKYPQLVPMPSAVQDWLDEQLEARGIDAVVYTRYILSLLQRDSLDLLDDPLSLSPSKEKEAGRRGRRRGRRDEHWNVWDSEQLKRSAAVECLMSASDQKFGIEKLVDELCAKLKEIQSEGENSVHLELSQPPNSNKKPHSPSLQDQIKKYYEAFPPLTSKLSKADCQSIIPEITSVWNGKKILATSFVTEGSDTKAGSRLWAGRENMKLRGQGSWDKESYGFAWNMAEERALGSEEAGYEPLRVLRCNQQNCADAGSLACRRLYERQADGDESLGTEILGDDDLDVDFDCPERTVDDGKLAQLIAKFDHNIEALWNADDQEDEENEQELPVDLNELLSSPSGEKSPVEVQCVNRSDPLGQAGNSFIHCGTNITNSIWSDNPSQDSSIEHESFGIEESSRPLSIQETDEQVEETVVDHDDVKVGSPVNTIPGDYVRSTFKSEIADCYRNLHRQQELFLNQHYDSLELGSIFNFAPKEDSVASQNRFQNFPPVFNNMSWGLNYPLREVTRGITVQALTEADDDTDRGGCANELGHISRPVGQSNSIHGSFTALNHNSEDSSFSVVVPRQDPPPSLAPVESIADQSVPTGGDDAPNQEGATEEEDLLTSSRTHFRPIRQDSSDSHNGNVGYYADGTTFMIPNNLENVTFKRSESGTLYLETEAGVSSPRKYMEYKEKEPYGGRYRIYVLEAMDDFSDFVPKFQVCQNEKCCQTEVEEESTVTSDEEVDPKRSRQDVPAVDETEEFFFPGDDHLVAKLINDIDNDDCEDGNSSSCSSCNGDRNGTRINANKETKPAAENDSDEWSNNIKICFKCNNNNNILAWRNGWLKDCDDGRLELWHSSSAEKPSWSDIWSNCTDSMAKPCESCALARAAGEDVKSLQYCRLREELSQDGEQLLSDLSYFQHLYLGSDWPDDGATELAGKERTPQKLACLFPADQSPQELSLYAEDRNRVAKQDQVTAGRGKCSMGCVPGKLPGAAQLPAEVREAGCKHNERPFSISIISKDRKRRHSASQRACGLPWDMATVSCRLLVADAACLKGIACPLHASSGNAYALRPVTL